MYRLLVVDDEYELIDGIKTIIDWEGNGIEICGEADNGASAWELINELSPDIVLMDIRMPIMNGLEVLERLANNRINSKCIILSGYDDFYYAQKAMDLGAINYLLKPCKPDEILQAVLKVKALLDDERSRDNLLKNYRQMYVENLPVLKEKLLTDIIWNRVRDYDKALSRMRLYNINLSDQGLLSAVLRIDSLNSLYSQYSDLDVETLKVAVVHNTAESLSDSCFHEIFQCGEEVVIILPSKDDSSIPEILDDVRNKIKASLNITVTIGIGRAAAGIESLSRSYNEAVSALEARFFLGDDRIISFDDIALLDNQTTPYPLNEETAIINTLSTGNSELVKSKVSSFYKSLSSEGAPSKKYLQRATMALVGSIYRFCMEKNIDTENLLGGELNFIDDIQKCETRSHLQEKVMSMLDMIMARIEERENKNILIKSAVDYIKLNYSQNICLETVAKQVYITPGYLSLMFKQEMGINFLDFVHKYRIQKAKELLKNGYLKNYEVADKVGYKDEKYFSQIFKRHTGLTPSQYKESINTYQ